MQIGDENKENHQLCDIALIYLQILLTRFLWIYLSIFFLVF